MDKRFNLSPAARCPITELHDVNLVRVPLRGGLPLASVKKRARVSAGSSLAVSDSPEQGDIHAPFDGVIKEVTPAYVEIAYEAPPPPAPENAPQAERPGKDAAGPAKPAGNVPAPVQPVSLADLRGAALCAALKSLGIGPAAFTKTCDVFIINGLNPEPGMMYAEELLETRIAVLEAGLSLLRCLNPARRFVLVLPRGSMATLKDTTPFHVAPVFPVSLRMPLIKAVTGREGDEGIGFLRLHRLFQLGLVASSGLPLTRTVITALGKNYIAPLGTPLEVFFSLAGTAPEEGDSIILGGAMRGVALSGLHRGIGKSDEAVQLFKKNSIPVLEDNPCINCAACVKACPVRLRPNMLSRYAEAGRYEMCRKERMDICIECGLCGYVCPSCRPMQQYFRMAKFNLGLRSLQSAYD